MSPPTLLIQLAKPWESLYSNSKGLEIFVTFLHVGGLLLGGGLAVATDRATVRAIRQAVHDRTQHLEALSSVHQTVFVGLVISFLSGVMLFSPTSRRFGPLWVSWLKMARGGSQPQILFTSSFTFGESLGSADRPRDAEC